MTVDAGRTRPGARLRASWVLTTLLPRQREEGEADGEMTMYWPSLSWTASPERITTIAPG